VETAALMGARGDARCATAGLTDYFTGGDNGCDEAWLVVVLKACKGCGSGGRSRGAATCWWSTVEVSRGLWRLGERCRASWWWRGIWRSCGGSGEAVLVVGTLWGCMARRG